MILTTASQLMIPIINEVFSEHFSDTADVMLLANEQLSMPEDGKQTKRITDSNIIVSEEIESYWKNAADVFDELLGQARDRFEISANHRNRHYIIECESKDFYDRCVIRVAVYVFKSALDKDAHLENLSCWLWTSSHIPEVSVFDEGKIGYADFPCYSICRIERKPCFTFMQIRACVKPDNAAN